MSSDQKEEHAKVYECKECGKQYLKPSALAAHLKTHAKAEESGGGFVTREEFLDFISSLKVQPLEAPTPSTPAQGGPPPVRLGRFIVREKSDGTADLFCPNCGTAEFSRPLPVKIEKETEEVEVVPPGYIHAPRGGEDWLRVLSLKHADGKGPEECPDCAKTLLSWFNQNRSKLERASRVAK